MMSIKSNKGFTLLELVIGIGLTSIILLGLSSLIFNSQKSSNSLLSSLDQESVRNRIRLVMSCEETIDKISSDGKNSLLFNSKGEEIFKAITESGRTLMDAGDFYIWMEFYDVNTGELELISINKKTNAERPLFRGASFFCPL